MPNRLLQFVSFILLVSCGLSVRAQDKGYDITSYDINLQIVRTQNYLQGVVTMQAKATVPLTSILQHLKGLTVDSVFVDNAKAAAIMTDSASVDGSYNVRGFTSIPSGQQFALKTYYHGNPTNEGGSNPWGGVTNTGQMMFAMGVGFSAPFISTTRYWLPCYDEPDDKADSVTMTFVVNDSDVVASNGLRTFNFDNLIAHQRTTRWKVSHPIASYLLTFATGPFVELNVAGPNGVPIQGFCFASDSARLAVEFNRRIIRTIALYDSLFGPYPFEKVGYVVAPIGSMEHQTMITLINQAIDTNSTTPQHELAHMWWGDWVTCKDFNDPWLNEGFAQFCESLVLEHDVSVARYWVKQRANISGAINGGSLIPMYGAPFLTTPRDNYPYAVIYQKGAAVLGMLRYMFGDSIFFGALREYGKAHAYGNATSYDLEHSLEQYAGQDLKWFFKQWVFGTWYPQLKVSWSPGASSYVVDFDQVQDTTKYQFFRMPIVIEAQTKAGAKQRTTVLMDSVAHTSRLVLCSFQPDTIIIDPDGALIKKIVGPLTRDTIASEDVPVDGMNVTKDIRYAVHFVPNPSSSGQGVQMQVSSLPSATGAVSVGESFVIQHLNELTEQGAELLLFDTNGIEACRNRLSRPTVERTAAGIEYRFSLPCGHLSSGTYFAKLLLDNRIVGDGRLVLTK